MVVGCLVFKLVQKYGILGNISTSVHKNKTDLVGQDE